MKPFQHFQVRGLRFMKSSRTLASFALCADMVALSFNEFEHHSDGRGTDEGKVAQLWCLESKNGIANGKRRGSGI